MIQRNYIYGALFFIAFNGCRSGKTISPEMFSGCFLKDSADNVIYRCGTTQIRGNSVTFLCSYHENATLIDSISLGHLYSYRYHLTTDTVIFETSENYQSGLFSRNLTSFKPKPIEVVYKDRGVSGYMAGDSLKILKFEIKNLNEIIFWDFKQKQFVKTVHDLYFDDQIFFLTDYHSSTTIGRRYLLFENEKAHQIFMQQVFDHLFRNYKK